MISKVRIIITIVKIHLINKYIISNSKKLIFRGYLGRDTKNILAVWAPGPGPCGDYRW